MMKTLVCVRPGLFEYQERAKSEREPGTTLLRIRRVGVCGTDLHAFRGTQPYFEYPRVLGHELAGEVVEKDGLMDFKLGEQVTLIPYLNCNVCYACAIGKTNCCANMRVCGVHVDGGMTEYFRVPTIQLLRAPGLELDSLALIEPLAVAAHGVRRAGVVPEDTVLVMGAGPIGMATMHMAKLAGARVFAVDIQQLRLDFCRNYIGVEEAFQVGEVDIAERLREFTGGTMATVVFDATGNLQAMEQGFQYMSHAGRYVLIGLQKEAISFSHPEFHKREGTLMSSRNATRADFEYVIKVVSEKRIDPRFYITHRARFAEVKDKFAGWLDPSAGVLKAMIDFD